MEFQHKAQKCNCSQSDGPCIYRGFVFRSCKTSEEITATQPRLRHDVDNICASKERLQEIVSL